MEEETEGRGITETQRTTLKRLPKRASYDREVINSILDEGFICHVGFAVEGKPFVIPTGYARAEDKLLIHGSQASRMLRTLSEGIDVCVTVTLLDGLVLARSAFHHSMNYRSVVIFGRATLVEDRTEKMSALFALSEHIIRHRWSDVRGPNESELRQTTCCRCQSMKPRRRFAPVRRSMMKRLRYGSLGWSPSVAPGGRTADFRSTFVADIEPPLRINYRVKSLIGQKHPS
jgi:nitroimidazol reductase NimA-like FMN-containing flavoprotein (pyridoxamine 5'-phosphate oxidase superfamily)